MKQMSEYNKRETDLQIIANKLVATSGETKQGRSKKGIWY